LKGMVLLPFDVRWGGARQSQCGLRRVDGRAPDERRLILPRSVERGLTSPWGIVPIIALRGVDEPSKFEGLLCFSPRPVRFRNPVAERSLWRAVSGYW